ncbi:MAG: TonB-dependent receptor [Solimonas sp.]
MLAAASAGQAQQPDPPAAGETPPAATPQPTPVPAPESTGGIAEIIVTSQKREQSLQEVPLAVSAIGAEELAERGITGLSSFQQGAVPALKVLPFAGSPTTMYVTMRGFAQPNAAQITMEGGVPIYIDDIYAGRPQAQALDLIELERVEVLRGPQGTLFGKNAAGGAVRFISKKPTGEFGLRQNVDIGNFGYWKSDTHVDLPSFAGIATKIDFLATGSDGWTDNPAPGQKDFGALESRAGRFSARWLPIDTLSVDYAFDYIDSNSSGAYNQPVGTSDPLNIWPTTKQRQDKAAYPLYRPYSPETLQAHTLDASWNLSDTTTLRSISGYRDLDSTLYSVSTGAASFPALAADGSCFAFDADGNCLYLSSPTVTYDVKQKQWSEELQLVGTADTLEWVAGLFYLHDEGSQLEATRFGLGVPFTATASGLSFIGPPTALAPPFDIGTPDKNNDVENTSWAAFGQVTWKPEALDRKLALTAGLRFGRDEKKATRRDGRIYDAPDYDGDVPFATCPCAPVKTADSEFSPLAVASYAWTRDVNTYLRYSTGYRGAGVGTNSDTYRPMKADHVYNWEAGVKADLLKRRLRFNLAAFHEDWKDPQLNVQTTAGGSTVEYFNGPDQTIEGVEIDMSILPIDDLIINLSYAGYKGEHDPAPNPYQNPAVTGDEFVIGDIVQLPSRSGSVAILYDFLHASYGTWKLNVDGSGSSPYATVPNANPVPGYWLWNARLALAGIRVGPGGGALDVTLWGRNLADKEYRVFQYQAPGVVAGTYTEQAVYGMPRSFGLNLAYRY